MSPELERETRKRRIDPRLRAAGWRVVPSDEGRNAKEGYSRAAAVEEYETPAGPADYALCDADRTLGVVEAKKPTVGLDGVLTQSQRYATCPKINQDIRAQVAVPMPSSATREAIVKKLEAAALSDAIARRLDVANRRIDISLQTILTKAFRGQLVGEPGD